MSNSFLFSLRLHKSGQLRRALYLSAGILMLVAGCRPSQQTRRTDPRNAAKNNATNSKATDSLLIVQEHLVDLIDTMSNALMLDRVRIKNLEIEVTRLRSLIEQQRVQSSSGYRLPSMNPPVPSPMQTSTVPSSAKTFSAPPTGGIPPNAPLPSSGTGGSANPERYARALQLFNEARYEEAMNAFDELTRDDAASPYAPNYLYWRGESQYALSRYPDAVASFKSVVDGYATSAKADDAQFKIGESYEKLGNKAAATSAYQRLLALYPETEYRTRVEGRLKRLQ
jgi:tol-pal system protein YbgF